MERQCNDKMGRILRQVEEDTNIVTTRKLMEENAWLRSRLASLEQLVDCMQRTMSRETAAGGGRAASSAFQQGGYPLAAAVATGPVGVAGGQS
jgi:hypothetical protein